MIRLVAGRCPLGRAGRASIEPSGLDQKATIPNAGLTAEDVRTALVVAFPLSRQSIANIQNVVAEFYGLEPRYMRTPDGVPGIREPRVAHPRQVAMLFAREFTKSSLPDIGRRFGGRDHSTVINAIRAVGKRAETDSLLEIELAVLRERFAG